MEAVLDHLEIKYSRFICGFSLKHHGQDDKYCALDWYHQSPNLREKGKDLWEHSIIIDQYSPTEWYRARVVMSHSQLYEGWQDHAVGQALKDHTGQ